MVNFNYVTKENIKEHYSNWPQIPDYPYRTLIIRGFGSGKTKLICMPKIHVKQNINF